MHADKSPKGGEYAETDDPDEFERQLIVAVKEWAERHPNPDAPLLTCGDKTVTAKELAEEMERGSPFGKQEVAVFRHLSQSPLGISAEEIIQLFATAGTETESP